MAPTLRKRVYYLEDGTKVKYDLWKRIQLAQILNDNGVALASPCEECDKKSIPCIRWDSPFSTTTKCANCARYSRPCTRDRANEDTLSTPQPAQPTRPEETTARKATVPESTTSTEASSTIHVIENRQRSPSIVVRPPPRQPTSRKHPFTRMTAMPTPRTTPNTPSLIERINKRQRGTPTALPTAKKPATKTNITSTANGLRRSTRNRPSPTVAAEDTPPTLPAPEPRASPEPVTATKRKAPVIRTAEDAVREVKHLRSYCGQMGRRVLALEGLFRMEKENAELREMVEGLRRENEELREVLGGLGVEVGVDEEQGDEEEEKGDDEDEEEDGIEGDGR